MIGLSTSPTASSGSTRQILPVRVIYAATTLAPTTKIAGS